MGSMPEGMTATQSIRAPNPPIEDSVFKMFRMDGRTVIITGGSGGIGYEVARGLAEAGANVRVPCSQNLSQRGEAGLTLSQIVLWYEKSPKAKQLAATIANDFGVVCKAQQVRVENYEEVEAAVAQAVEDFGRLDVM
jgi:sorbose reductase